MRKKMRIQTFLESGSRSHYDFPADKQREYLESLGAPNDNIDRSYKQYLCQRYYMPWYIKLLNDILYMFASPLYAVLCLFERCKLSRGEKVDCIGEFKGMAEIIPKQLEKEYDINLDYWFTEGSLDWDDLQFVMKFLVRHPFSPLFVGKSMMKIAKYSTMIHRHSPKAIAVHNEYSFTSSLLTEYCHRHGVKHINVMHGEKLFIIRDSFFCYDKCYVWDLYYANLFISLKAEPTQFAIALPESMHIDCGQHKNKAAFADYKYYLASPDEKQMRKIAESMAFAAKEGKSVKYRLHPRYSDAGLVEKIVGKENVEYPCETTIMDSISNCGCVVGSYTTVLNQAYNSGVSVLLDDVAEEEMFEKLKSFRYILIDKGLPRLSGKQE